MLKDCGVINTKHKNKKNSVNEADTWISTNKLKENHDGLLAIITVIFFNEHIAEDQNKYRYRLFII